MLVDLKKQLVFPRGITITTLWPDIVIWSAEEKRVFIIELTISLEGNITAAHERKHLKYSEWAAECQEASWNAKVYPWRSDSGASSEEQWCKYSVSLAWWGQTCGKQ